MKLWELLFAPSITQKYIWHGMAKADRILGGFGYSLLQKSESFLTKKIDDIHPTGLFEAEEDYLALLPIMACFILVLPLPQQPFWRQSRFDLDLPEQDKQTVINFYRMIVQRHLYFQCQITGEEYTYLSKNPSFTPMVKSLAQYFKDAHFIVCVRNPTSVVPSQVNSMIVGAKLFDPHSDEIYWRNRLTNLMKFYYEHLMTFLDSGSASAYVVPMESSTQNPFEIVKGFYQHCNWEMGEDYKMFLLAEQANAQKFKSNHHYSLQNLGISERVLEQEFSQAYCYFRYPTPSQTNLLS